MDTSQHRHEQCISCVYDTRNLPASAYTEEVQAKSCSFDYQPEDGNCRVARKTSCSLHDPEQLQQSSQKQETIL